MFLFLRIRLQPKCKLTDKTVPKATLFRSKPRVGLWKSIFTWWDGPTLGTQLHTRRFGRRVGQDAQGNVYYEAKKGGRRWVIYNGPAEASRVPPEWHGWLHRTTDVLPEDAPIQPKSWEKPHVPNRSEEQTSELQSLMRNS